MTTDVTILIPTFRHAAVLPYAIDSALDQEGASIELFVVGDGVEDATREVIARYEGDERVHFFVHARLGQPAQEILDLAREVGADLIIVGSTGMTGVERVLIGSTSEHIVRDAHCTVEVARPKKYRDVELVPVEEVDRPHTYVPPHRYTYEDHRVNLRPAEWPLY